MGLSKQKYLLLSGLLVLGMLISLFLLYQHMALTPIFCFANEEYNCDIVNKGPYSNLEGISYLLTIEYGWNLPLIDFEGKFFNILTSNAFLGFVTLLILLGMVSAAYKKEPFYGIKKEKVLPWIRWIFVWSVFYACYLFFIQHYVLHTYCLFCLGLDAVLVLSLVVVWWNLSIFKKI